MKVLAHFFELANDDDNKDKKFFVCDIDLYPEQSKMQKDVSIKLYSKGILSCDDLYSNSAHRSLAKSDSISRNIKITKRSDSCILKLVCPKWRHLYGCSMEKKKWRCERCNSFLKYDYDYKFYCICGSAPCDTFKFKCSDPNHPNEFSPYPDIKTYLDEIKFSISLNQAKKLIINLAKPISEIAINIDENIKRMQDKHKELSSMDQELVDLRKDLYVDQIILVPEAFDHSRTVCTSAKCVRHFTNKNGIIDTEYIQHCHANCKCIKDVPFNTTNNAYLKDCAAMDEKGRCKKCSCLWNMHMNITYEIKRVNERVMDQNQQKRINEKTNKKEEINKYLTSLMKLSEELKKEKR
jgi:hypothetical protein